MKPIRKNIIDADFTAGGKNIKLTYVDGTKQTLSWTDENLHRVGLKLKEQMEQSKKYEQILKSRS